jgi:hypothetical protein
MNKNICPNLSPEDREKIGLYLADRNHINQKARNIWLILINIILVLFAIIGFGFLAVYFAVNLHITNADGIIDRQTEVFWDNSKNLYTSTGESVLNDSFFTDRNYCLLKIIKSNYPGTFYRILNLALDDKKDLANNNLDVAIKNYSMTNNGYISCGETYGSKISKKDFEIMANIIDRDNLFLFASSSEWSFFKMGVLKDKEIINQVEKETGIKSRVLVSQLVAEQLRLFYSDRVWFEKAISPVKVLASMSQFSWGVLGIKQETAVRIENNLKSKESVFYLGSEYENMLNFSTTNIDQERFKRITDYHNHYYAYLYCALFNKQIITQWQRSGFDISHRPEILATIYNIGFNGSKPNDDPQMGGSELEIGGNKYSFGRLAYEFYYSGELLDEYPQ